VNTCIATPGCVGTVEDGFCTVCGMEAPAGMVAPAGLERPFSQESMPSAPLSAGSAMMLVTGSARTGSPTGSPATGRTGSTGPSRRGMLGIGMVEVPPVPYRDPATAIMQHPEVPERKRFCSVCGNPVGRSRGGRPGRSEGFCPKDRTPYSFQPKLRAGELVGAQYEVLGCLAHGGLGWVYLARDKHVSDRWVVLKGLLDTGDADAMLAAAAERAFLAEVEHPNVVKIYNFVQHPNPTTGQLVGYIVMEYVGGRSLKDILAERRANEGENAVLPLGQVIAYGLEVLRALGYLHDQGMLYCDFKPDNAIQSEEQLKLIDLGGLRRADDKDSAIFGTVGYQAPEIAADGPSISSDLYTVGRALAVLSFPFRGYTSTYATSLPPRADVQLLTWYESFDRLLRRATHAEPGKRFQDAAEMAEQLTGVLREVLSAQDGVARPAPSTLFGPEQDVAGTDVALFSGTAGSDRAVPVLPPLDSKAAVAALPVPLVHGADPAAGFLASLTARDPADLVAALTHAPAQSPEVGLMLARARIGLGELAAAGTLLDEMSTAVPGDWRVDWYRGVAALAGGRFPAAARGFEQLYDLLPGEAAPKLALAFSHEVAGQAKPDGTDRIDRIDRTDRTMAARYYEMVWRTDRTYVSAAFGLARVRLAEGDRAGAIEVLDSVPAISSQHVAAQLAAVAAAVRGRTPAELAEKDLAAAGRRLQSLRLDAERRARLSAEVLEGALAWVLSGQRPATADVLDAQLTEDGLRRKLEETYRALARLVDGPGDRHALINRANTVRPRTLV
jgi:serine/threonine-protein kinase PknG